MVSWYLFRKEGGVASRGQILGWRPAKVPPSPSLVLPVPALLASHDVDAAVEHADAGPVAPLMHRADKVPRVLRNVVPLHLVRVLGRGMPTAC